MAEGIRTSRHARVPALRALQQDHARDGAARKAEWQALPDICLCVAGPRCTGMTHGPTLEQSLLAQSSVASVISRAEPAAAPDPTTCGGLARRSWTGCSSR